MFKIHIKAEVNDDLIAAGVIRPTPNNRYHLDIYWRPDAEAGFEQHVENFDTLRHAFSAVATRLNDV